VQNVIQLFLIHDKIGNKLLRENLALLCTLDINGGIVLPQALILLSVVIAWRRQNLDENWGKGLKTFRWKPWKAWSPLPKKYDLSSFVIDSKEYLIAKIGVQKKKNKYKEKVKKKREILSKCINCIKICGKFELLLRCHDESPRSLNPGFFRGPIKFAGMLD